MKSSMGVLIRGFFMGTAEILPGISGSTIAMITGIYEDFIDLINSVTDLAKTLIVWGIGRGTRKKIKLSFCNVNWKFGGILFAGMGIAIIILSSLLHAVLKTYPIYLDAFLFGLILASIYMPLKRVKKLDKWVIIMLFFTAIIVFVTLGLADDMVDRKPSLLGFFLGGFFAASAFTLPGVSGSFILLLLGLYYSVLEMIVTVSRGNVGSDSALQVMIFFSGIVAGLVVMSKIIGWALNKYHDLTMALLIGLMLGSLRILYPFGTNDENILIIIALVILGLTLVGVLILISHFSKKNKSVIEIK